MHIPIGLGRLHVERFGFGDRPVVLLHGFGTSGFLWRRVAPLLPLGRVTAFAVDFLGHGASDRITDADYGVLAQVDYIDAAMGALAIGRADVVGVDVGAAVALALAARRAARVRTLVLVNPPNPAQVRCGAFSELRRLAARRLVESSRGMLGAAALLGPILERSVADPARMPRTLVARYAATFVGRDGVRHLMELERAVNDRALARVQWQNVGVPTLVVRGDKDEWVHPDVSAALANRLAGGELRRLANSARLTPEDAPDELAGHLREWIDRTGRPGSATTP